MGFRDIKRTCLMLFDDKNEENKAGIEILQEKPPKVQQTHLVWSLGVISHHLQKGELG